MNTGWTPRTLRHPLLAALLAGLAAMSGTAFAQADQSGRLRSAIERAERGLPHAPSRDTDAALQQYRAERQAREAQQGFHNLPVQGSRAEDGARTQMSPEDRRALRQSIERGARDLPAPGRP